MFVIANIAHFFGPLRVIIFALVIILLSLISLGLIGADIGLSDSSEIKNDDNTGDTKLQKNKVKLKSATDLSDLCDDYFAKSLSGDAHLRIIGGLCVLLWAVHYDIFLIFFFIPFFIAVFIKCGKIFSLKIICIFLKL